MFEWNITTYKLAPTFRLQHQVTWPTTSYPRSSRPLACQRRLFLRHSSCRHSRTEWPACLQGCRFSVQSSLGRLWRSNSIIWVVISTRSAKTLETSLLGLLTLQTFLTHDFGERFYTPLLQEENDGIMVKRFCFQLNELCSLKKIILCFWYFSIILSNKFTKSDP